MRLKRLLRMRMRGQFYLVWLAVALNAAAPVVAFAHIHLATGGEVIEDCAADEGEARHRHSHDGKGTTPHCVYCPGFSACATPAHCVLAPAEPEVVATMQLRQPESVSLGPSSVRFAQPRGPPAFS